MTKSSVVAMEPKQHFHLIAGKVIAMIDGNITSVDLNAVLRTKSTSIKAKDIGRANQTLQLTLAQKVGDPTIQMMDAMVYGISYLGHMKNSEFLEGVNAEEQQNAEASIQTAN